MTTTRAEVQDVPETSARNRVFGGEFNEAIRQHRRHVQIESKSSYAALPYRPVPPKEAETSDPQSQPEADVQDDNSLQQLRESLARALPVPPTTDPSQSRPAAPPSTDFQGESADDMVLRLSNEFQPIVEPDWDTVVYIGPPPQEHQQDDHEYKYIEQHFSKPYLMNSKTLKDAGSTRFEKLLGPMSARAERRLKKLGVHRQLPKDRIAKYYIDLRPMQDDEEALLMLTELTCTSGVLSWHTSHLASGIPKILVGGKDNLNFTSKPHARPWIEVNDAAMDEAYGEKNRDFDLTTTSTDILDLEPEYSALRHHTAIERLLHALAGKNPKLNSAPKVWTYFSIAKFFDCTMVTRVTSWIYNWLLHGNNTNFIQANPEVAYRMALGMRSPDILRTTFAMLVGERALTQAGWDTSTSKVLASGVGQVSAHGRTMCHLDDDEINRIDHAAHSLTRRVRATFDSLANGPLNWTSGRSELAKLHLILDTYSEKEVVEEPYKLLCDYVRGEIYQGLSQNVSEGDLMRLYRTKGFKEFGWLRRSRSFADAYNVMPLPQRLLTQSFWSQLENYGLYQEPEKTFAWSRAHSLAGLSDLAPDLPGEIDCVAKESLCNMINYMNSEISGDRQWMTSAVDQWKLAVDDSHTYDEDDQFDQVAVDGEFVSPDQEVVRAMQGIYRPEDPLTAMAPHRLKPYHHGSYNRHYPYTRVAMNERVRGGPFAVSSAMLLAELSMAMRKRIMQDILTPGYANEEIGIESEISISQMDILLCLNEDEWKYLPLWAGGLDDGSGGVFAELDVPDMEAIEGFRGGKMGLGGLQDGEGSEDGSYTMVDGSEDFDKVMTDEGVSTVGRASRIATDGTTSTGASTVMSLDD